MNKDQCSCPLSNLGMGAANHQDLIHNITLHPFFCNFQISKSKIASRLNALEFQL